MMDTNPIQDFFYWSIFSPSGFDPNPYNEDTSTIDMTQWKSQDVLAQKRPAVIAATEYRDAGGMVPVQRVIPALDKVFTQNPQRGQSHIPQAPPPGAGDIVEILGRAPGRIGLEETIREWGPMIVLAGVLCVGLALAIGRMRL